MISFFKVCGVFISDKIITYLQRLARVCLVFSGINVMLALVLNCYSDDCTCVEIRKKVLIIAGAVFGLFVVLQTSSCVLFKKVKDSISIAQPGTYELTQVTTPDNQQANTSTHQQPLSSCATISSPHLQHPHYDLDHTQVHPEARPDLASSQTSHFTSL